MHDLDERRLARCGVDGPGGAHDRPHLHLVDLGEDQPHAAAPHAEHRVRLLEHANPLAHVLVDGLLERGQELVERRIEQPDRHRHAGHRAEDALEVRLLHGENPLQGGAAAVGRVGEDHLPHHRQPLLDHEHVLGAAEADPLRAELARLGGILGRVGVRADGEPTKPVSPLEHRLEVLVDLRRHEGNLAEDHAARAPVDRQQIALRELMAVDVRDAGLDVDGEPFAPGHAGLAHAACDDGGVRRHPSVRREHALRVQQPVDVVGSRLPADEDHRLARLAQLLRPAGVEDDPPRSRARRGVQARRDDLDRRLGIDHRMEQLVELRGIDPRHRLLPRDHALGHHVDGRLQRGRRGALRRARLEDVQPVVLDRELDVLHVAVVRLEPRHRLEELGVRGGQPLGHERERLGSPDAGDDVLALRVHEELAERDRLAGRRVAREADAGARALALVAEHHLHDVHGRAEVVGDVVRAAIDLRARRLPRLEDGDDGADQLRVRVLGERGADVLLVDLAEGVDEAARGPRP